MGMFAQEPLLTSLLPSDRAALLAAGAGRTCEPGAVLMRQGDAEDFVVAITTGWAVVRSAAVNGRSLILGLRGPGDLVGELAVLDGQPRSATVSALTRMEARVLRGAAFRSFLRDHPRASVAVLRGMALRMRQTDEHSQDLAALPVLQRLARLLIDIDHAGPDGAIVRRLTQSDLATAIGATRESVAKALGDLRSRGVLSTGQRQIRIADKTTLAAIAEL
jgi:CRP/FNR family transcriptional regulator, cyclic AMP receptor protein